MTSTELNIASLRNGYAAMLEARGMHDTVRLFAVMDGPEFLLAVVCDPGLLGEYLGWVTEQEGDLDEAIGMVAASIDYLIRSDELLHEDALVILSAMVGVFALFAVFAGGVNGDTETE